MRRENGAAPEERVSRRDVAASGAVASAIDGSPMVAAQCSRLDGLFGDRAREARPGITSGNGAAQRLSDTKVRRLFSDNETMLEMTAGGAVPSPEVVELIARRTTEWEALGRNLRHKTWRAERCASWIHRFLGRYGAGQPGDWVLWDLAQWNGYLDRVFASLEALCRPDAERIVGRFRELEAGGAGERIRVDVAMGQGARGDLSRFNFYSGSFSSCTPVAMYNDATRMGGLFHYAAGNRRQDGELRSMYDAVAPTWVTMPRRRGGDVDNRADCESVNALLDGNVASPLLNGDGFTFGLNADGVPWLRVGDVEGVRLNLTGLVRVPDEIAGPTSLAMHHVREAYDDAFETLP
jgi:hypothetical protein